MPKDGMQRLTLHVEVSQTLPLKVSLQEARNLYEQLQQHFISERKNSDEVPDNVCSRCGKFKRGERVGPDMYCFKCHYETDYSYQRELQENAYIRARERRKARSP